MNTQIQKQLAEQDEVLKNIITQMPYEATESTRNVFRCLEVWRPHNSWFL